MASRGVQSVPSVAHEVIVEIVREHPEHVLALLRAAFGVTYDGALEVIESAENLTEIRPPERRADAVIVVRRPGRRRPVKALVVEVQLRRDARKRLSWPAYVAVLHARLACRVSSVVLCLDASVARWCARPIALDDHGSRLVLWVLGPDELPPVDVALARRHPELAVLWLLAHRGQPTTVDLGRAVLPACGRLDGSPSFRDPRADVRHFPQRASLPGSWAAVAGVSCCYVALLVWTVRLSRAPKAG